MTIFWEKTGDPYFLQKLSVVLSKGSISIDAKDFYIDNNFFWTVTQANIIALYMHKLRCTSYENFAI